MTGEDVFKIAMAMIDEMQTNGTLDGEATAEYRAKAPSILTMLQNELIGIENRFLEESERRDPIPIDDLSQEVQISTIMASTLLTNGLAAHLMLTEDKNLANFFEARYEEMKGMFLKPIARRPETREDKYDASLSY